MTTNYNQGQVAEQYRKAKEQPWRSLVETYTFMKRIGDLKGKSVIDIACGGGHFTRRLRQGGAARVVGVDISERMIAQARFLEEQDPLDIEYRVEDARSVAPYEEDFDLAVSAWLLVYAHDRPELASMCKGLASRLQSGGRLVTLTTNSDLYASQPLPDYRKYGFTTTLADQVYEGAPILWNILLDDSSLEIENYYLPISAYETALQSAGFRDFQIHGLELDPQEHANRDYWADLLDYPIAIVIECVKE